MNKTRSFIVFAVVVSVTYVLGDTLLPARAEGELLGKELGDAMGLIAEQTSLSDCNGWFAEYAEGVGYCLNPVIGPDTTDIQAWDLAQRISGHVPTELERQIYLINLEIARLSESGLTSEDAEMLELIDQLGALKAQQEQGSSSR